MNQVILKKLNESVRPDFAMAKRVIAVGDVHGQFNLLRDLVENQIKFDPTSDVLVFLGDYIDRGRSAEDEIAVLNYLIDLHNGNPGKIVLLRGNHEQMAINAISNADCEEEQWLGNTTAVSSAQFLICLSEAAWCVSASLCLFTSKTNGFSCMPAPTPTSLSKSSLKVFFSGTAPKTISAIMINA